MTNTRHQTQHRVLSLAVYAAILAAVQYFVVSSGFTPNERAIWLYSGFASLLFGSRFLNPHFTPPADAATNSFVALSALFAGTLVVPTGNWDWWLLWAGIICCAAICVLSILARLIHQGALPVVADVA